MTYTPNIPQSTDIPSQSQSQILTNFQQLNTIFDINHSPFNDATPANRGKHDKVDFLRQGADPGAAGTELVVYQKLQTGNSELFLQRDGIATAIQLTSGSISNAINGFTFLPGKLLIQWGVGTASEAGFLNNFPTSFLGNAYSLTGNRRLNAVGTGITMVSATATQFTARSATGAGTVDIYWIAIGSAP